MKSSDMRTLKPIKIPMLNKKTTPSLFVILLVILFATFTAFAEESLQKLRQKANPDNWRIGPAKLYMEVTPSNAEIRFSDKGKTFKQGMELEQGSYTLSVTAEDYISQALTVRVDPLREKVIRKNIRLKVVGFVFIKGGCFQMGDQFGGGDSDEKPVHKVCLDDFMIGKYEVTQRQWKKIMGDNPSRFKNGDSYPVEKVSWNDVQNFISKLNRQSDGKYRLPTEAEWEYACRSGGQRERYCGGNSLDQLAWYGDNSGSRTHQVGAKKPNGLGLYDMSGNVWEWVQDWYGEEYYGSSPRKNPKGSGSGSFRVIRGGSWGPGARFSRSANRDINRPSRRYIDIGFRLLRTP